MQPTRTIAPALAGLLGGDEEAKALAMRVQRSATAIGLALRATSGPAVSLTKADVAFLRQWQAEGGADPATALREAGSMLRAVATNARTITLQRATDGTIDLPKLGSAALTSDGRKLTVSIPKDTPAEQVEALKLSRSDAANGHKAYAWLDTLAILEAAWSTARARSVTWKVPTLDARSKPVTAGKRLESHAAALLAADEDKLKAVLVGLGLPEDAIGVILAKAAATRAAAAQPAAIAAPVA